MPAHHSFSGPSNRTLHSSFWVSFRHASHTASTSFPEYAPLSFGIQISISRSQAAVLMSFVRYHPLLLVNPPPDLPSDVR